MLQLKRSLITATYYCSLRQLRIIMVGRLTTIKKHGCMKSYQEGASMTEIQVKRLRPVTLSITVCRLLASLSLQYYEYWYDDAETLLQMEVARIASTSADTRPSHNVLENTNAKPQSYEIIMKKFNSQVMVAAHLNDSSSSSANSK